MPPVLSGVRLVVFDMAGTTVFDDGLVLRNLAIKHAQRIGSGAALAVLAHTGNHRLKRLAQSLVVRRTVARATDRI